MSAQPIDILTAAQDDLLAALIAGQIKTKDLPTVYKAYRAELLAAGFSASEAVSLATIFGAFSESYAYAALPSTATPGTLVDPSGVVIPVLYLKG